jgi:hypothetical protein
MREREYMEQETADKRDVGKERRNVNGWNQTANIYIASRRENNNKNIQDD